MTQSSKAGADGTGNEVQERELVAELRSGLSQISKDLKTILHRLETGAKALDSPASQHNADVSKLIQSFEQRAKEAEAERDRLQRSNYDLQERLLYLERELADIAPLARRAAESDGMLRQARKELEEIENSEFWRMTAPFRNILTRLRGQ